MSLSHCKINILTYISAFMSSYNLVKQTRWICLVEAPVIVSVSDSLLYGATITTCWQGFIQVAQLLVQKLMYTVMFCDSKILCLKHNMLSFFILDRMYGAEVYNIPCIYERWLSFAVGLMLYFWIDNSSSGVNADKLSTFPNIIDLDYK